MVEETQGAIGYVESSLAYNLKTETALLQNKQGDFLAPTSENASKAIASTSFPSNFRVFNGDPSEGYPIVGLTWLLINK